MWISGTPLQLLPSHFQLAPSGTPLQPLLGLTPSTRPSSLDLVTVHHGPQALPSDTHLSPWNRLNALASLPSTAFTCQTPRSGNTLLTYSGLHPSTKSPNVAGLKIRSRLAGLNFMNSELEWILSGAWQHCLISPINLLPYYSRGSFTPSLSKPAPSRIQTSHSSARPTLFLSQDICTSSSLYLPHFSPDLAIEHPSLVLSHLLREVFPDSST